MFKSSYAIWLFEDVDFLITFWPHYTSSIGTYLQPANQLVKSAITFEPYKIT